MLSPYCLLLNQCRVVPYARLLLLAPRSSSDMNKLALRADTLLAKVPENYEKPKQLDWYDSNRKSWSGAERGGTAVCPATNGSHDLQGESEFGERSAERDGED